MNKNLPKNPLILEARRVCEEGRISFEAYQAFRSQVHSAKHRGIAFLFTIEQWWNWWQTDDRWSKRGMGKDALVMARIGDVGPYSPDNVMCITHAENGAQCDHVAHGEALRAAWYRKTPEQQAQHHLAVRGDGHPRSRAVLTPQGRYGSAALAGEAYGITRQAAFRRAKKKLYGWSFEVARHRFDG